MGAQSIYTKVFLKGYGAGYIAYRVTEIEGGSFVALIERDTWDDEQQYVTYKSPFNPKTEQAERERIIRAERGDEIVRVIIEVDEIQSAVTA